MNDYLANSYLKCVLPILVCIFITVTYVGSLYIWSYSRGSDHPSTIKRRFISVFFISFVSILVSYFTVDRAYFGQDVSFLTIVGISVNGLLQAIFIPLVLTMVLFTGSMLLHHIDGLYNTIFDLKMWRLSFNSTMFWRNYVIAPLCEEVSFRACMLPLLVPCFGNSFAIIMCPLFFGLAHLHFLYEKVSQGVQFKTAFFNSLFQFTYTTIFGAYSSFLFLRTGHLLSVFVVHAFCNRMAFPDLQLLFSLAQPKRSWVMGCFVLGLILWAVLLVPLTKPSLYGNTIYWKESS